MTKSVICALSAALVVPALVQPAMAADSKAEAFVESSLELTAAVGEIYKAIDSEEATPDEAGEALAMVVEGLQAIKAELGNMSDADLKELEEIMTNPEVAQALETIDAATATMMENLKAADYLGSETLKAACEAYSAL